MLIFRTLASLSLLIALSGAASATTCPSPTGLEVKTLIPVASTTSPTFIDIQDTVVHINVVGGSRCVVVRFSTGYTVASGAVLAFQAILDARKIIPPGGVNVPEGTPTGASSFEFVLQNVGNGVHRVRMQFSSFPTGNGGTVQVGGRTLTVTY